MIKNIRLGKKDIVLKAWMELCEVNNINIAPLIKVAIRSYIGGSYFCVGKISKQRIVNCTSKKEVYPLTINELMDIDIVNWIKNMESFKYKISTLIKAVLMNSITIIEHEEDEYIPTYADLGNMFDHLTKAIAVAPVPMSPITPITPVTPPAMEQNSESVHKTIETIETTKTAPNPKTKMKSQLANLGRVK